MARDQVTSMRSLAALLLLGAFLLSGCQSARPLYYWGNYENVTYLGYSKPDKATLEFQLQQLQEDVAKAAATHATPNPGLHAQLGYVSYQLGRVDDALREFETEKSIFPESAPFMDRMIARTKGGQSK